MDVTVVIAFVVGVLAGALAAAVWLGVRSDRRVAEAEARVAAELEQARRDAADADLAHHETKQRLIALQLAQVGQGAGNGPGARAGVAVPGAPDDLKRIKGIGPAIERRLRGMGITRIEQIAQLSPAEIERIDAQLDFPGRIRRERWVEQARVLTGD